MLDIRIEDIKVLFDAIRNIGICVALTLGLPFIEAAIPIIFDNAIVKIIAIGTTFGVILGLYSLNLLWLYTNLKGAPKSKYSHFIGFFIIVITITVAIGGAAFAEVWHQLFSSQ